MRLTDLLSTCTHIINISKSKKIDLYAANIHLFRLRPGTAHYILKLFINSKSLWKRESYLQELFRKKSEKDVDTCSIFFPTSLIEGVIKDLKIFRKLKIQELPEKIEEDQDFRYILYEYYKITPLSRDKTLKKMNLNLKTKTLLDIHYKKVDLIGCLVISSMVLPDITNSSISYNFSKKLLTVLDPCRIVHFSNFKKLPQYMLRARLMPKLDQELTYNHEVILKNLKMEDPDDEFRESYFKIMDDRLAMDIYLSITEGADKDLVPDTRHFLFSGALNSENQKRLKELFSLLGKEVVFHKK